MIVYLDDILIYTENEGEEHIQAVQQVLDQLQKHSLYDNLKKCRFHQDEVRFLGYIVSHQDIRMEEKQIKAVRNWPEPQLVHDIQVFLGFANFYRQFIQGFSRLAAPLISMLKTASAAGPANKNLEQSSQRIQVEDQGEKKPAQKSHKGQKGQKTAKSKKWIYVKKAEAFKAKNFGQPGTFFTADTKKAFTKLKQAFVEASIPNHFDPEHHILIKTDTLGYVIDGMLSQLTSDNSS